MDPEMNRRSWSIVEHVQDEDEDITVIDVINTTQELPRGEDSETESFGSGDRDSFEEDGSGPDVSKDAYHSEQRTSKRRYARCVSTALDPK